MRLRAAAVLVAWVATGLGTARREPPVPAGAPLARFEHEEGRAKRVRAALAAMERGPVGPLPPSVEGALRGYDVLTYDLSFALDPANVFLEGRAVIRISGVSPETKEVALDFHDGYTLTETRRDGNDVTPLARGGGKLVLPIEPPLAMGRRTTLSVSWRGVPPAGGALTFWQHETGPAAGNISEPFGARDFFPCVDDPRDKAVVTVHVTVPPGMVAASSGLLTTADEPDGRRTFTWRLPQPIPTYLVSLAVANYVKVEGSYVRLDGRTMPLISYVLPENEASSRQQLAVLGSQIGVFAPLFGEYPFADTKYGIAASHFGGGMEHPTMTAIGAVPLADPKRDMTLLLAHELAHQWWGDAVTMRTWDDIWLNEGFATYAEVLYLEKAQGTAPGEAMRNRDDRRYDGALARPVVADPADPFAYTSAVYLKGAWAVHMLRRTVGDDVFFDGLKRWLVRHEWGTATRRDLRALYEELSRRSLKYFFDQWLETPFRPVLRVTFTNNQDGTRVTINVNQTQAHDVVHPEPGPDDTRWYGFPLTVRLSMANGRTADVTVPVSGRSAAESFDVPTPFGVPVLLMETDAGNELLKVVEFSGRG
ncbi:MAG TPA: M1 family metallopeptidase [Thermoanaerobaculia bacterium]|nr:M1 family metallopeptidase [Thermoanaerobaculia bacterium]